jgi:hypothetical protein
MMNQRLLAAFIATLTLVSLACGVIDSAVNRVTGGGDMRTVSQLWGDVPRMDGLAPSPADIPGPLKLVVRGVIGNLGLLNSSAEDRTTGNIDWIAFTSAKTLSDVENFYTKARMATTGWQTGDTGTCMAGNEQNLPTVGLLCAFAKKQGAQQTVLAIIAAQDDQTKQTTIFFLRLEETGTPVPGQ